MLRRWFAATVTVTFVLSAGAGVRVQDVARLQGQRTNPLMGYGLVVGLAGTGDGGKSAATARALMSMHRRFAQEVLEPVELKNVGSVALVAVEASIPEYGARSGQALDVRVATVGEAKSLRGGRLLITPLQYAMFDPERPETQRIFALAGGNVELTESGTPTVGTIRAGAVLEADFYYNFIEDGAVTLVISDAAAGYPMAHAVARAVNVHLTRPARSAGRAAPPAEPAAATGPKTVRVTIPPYELAAPANFISRVLEAEIFAMPEQPARVTIGRADRQISISGAVTVSPTILFVPGLGSVMVGAPGGPASGRSILADGSPATRDRSETGATGHRSETGVTGQLSGASASGGSPVPLEELLRTLSRVAVPPDQIVKAVEHLHRSGNLHAQLVYRE